MTAAERVTSVTAHLDAWRTLPEIARRLQQRKSLVRWAIQQAARSRPVFCRRRDPVCREYRVFPEAVDVRVRE